MTTQRLLKLANYFATKYAGMEKTTEEVGSYIGAIFKNEENFQRWSTEAFKLISSLASKFALQNNCNANISCRFELSADNSSSGKIYPIAKITISPNDRSLDEGEMEKKKADLSLKLKDSILPLMNKAYSFVMKMSPEARAASLNKENLFPTNISVNVSDLEIDA
jgi:hypothetical protein